MKKTISSIAALFAVFSLVSCGNKQENAQNAQAAAAKAAPVVAVKVPTKTVTTYDVYPARMQGIINSEARPKISGYITDVLVDEGQKVHKGEVLFKLETASLSEEAQAAKANINAAKVQVNQLKPLVEKGIISENQLTTAQAKLKQTQASYQSIIANIGYATIKSPVDGFVGSIRIRKGNLVSPSSAQPLTTVSDVSKVYAYFSMNEKEYLNFLAEAEGETKVEKIANMPKVTLIMANGQAYEHQGTIDAINSQVDPQTGAISFRAVFDNPEHLLSNGSTGSIKLPLLHKNKVVVPQKSTYERQGITYVMTIQKTDKGTVVNPQAIDVTGQSGNLFIVASGLKAGQEIAAESVASLRPGTPVKPMVKPFDSIAKPVPTVFKN